MQKHVYEKWNFNCQKNITFELIFVKTSLSEGIENRIYKIISTAYYIKRSMFKNKVIIYIHICNELCTLVVDSNLILQKKIILSKLQKALNKYTGKEYVEKTISNIIIRIEPSS